MTATFDPTLLPAEAEMERCAAHAERIDLDPGGTALWVDELIVVDVALPWPKPVWAADGFTAVPELVMAAGEAGRRVRVLAAVPLADGIGRVVTHRLTDQAQFARVEHQVDPAGIPGLLERLLAGGLEASPQTVASTAARRELLLCTQGSHDVCCGARGTSMWNSLLAADPSFSIRRVSHTGGHRMAPTGLTLPDGRMWGMVSVDEMTAILRADSTPAAVAHRCRGWVGAAGGAAQMAERAVMAEVDDWGFDETARMVRVIEEGDEPNGITAVEVIAGADRWRVEIEGSRAVPTIACGAPGGLPAKPGAEWRVRSITRQS
jgi:hypothetical protein